MNKHAEVMRAYGAETRLHGLPGWALSCNEAAAEIERLEKLLADIRSQADASTEYVLAQINADLREQLAAKEKRVAELEQLIMQMPVTPVPPWPNQPWHSPWYCHDSTRCPFCGVNHGNGNLPCPSMEPKS